MIITQTPLRVSFLGGGTDYPEYFQEHGGLVLGSAANIFAYFSVCHFYSELFDYRIRIAYRQVECVNSIDEITHTPFKECLRWCNINQDVEINLTAELPAHTGLGSSSTFVVGLLNSLYAYQGRFLKPIELAYEAIDLERRVLGESVGCQDQVFAAVGGFNLIEFKSLNNILVHRVPISAGRLNELESHLMLFFTGIRRRSESIAAKKVRNVHLNLQNLAKLKRLAEQGYNLLSSTGSLTGFGELLHHSWKIKRELADTVSSEIIDRIYENALAAGALGGKLLGAGGGGFFLFFVPPERQDAVRQKLSNLKEIECKLNAPGTQIIHPTPAKIAQEISPEIMQT